jgi:flavin-dependent dehydrogenase
MRERVPRVVIVGGGFGGLAAARALRRTPAHVTVIDRMNHHVFQPLLYQVATSVLTPGQIGSPLLRGAAHKLTIRVAPSCAALPLRTWATSSTRPASPCATASCSATGCAGVSRR